MTSILIRARSAVQVHPGPTAGGHSESKIKMTTGRHVRGDGFIKSVRKLGLLTGLSGPALVIALLFSSHCKHYYLITPGHIVDVIASSLE